MRIYWSGLRFRLLVLVLLALLPGLAFFLYNASEQRHQSAVHNQQDALRLARLVAANQKYLIEGARYLLITLSQLPPVRDQDAATCSIYMANLLAQYAPYSNFGAVDREGNIFCMGRELKRPVNIADRAYFQGATQRREFAVGDFQISRSNELTVITFGYPVFDGQGQVQGIVFAGLDLRWLNQFIVDASLPEGADLGVIDRNGTILAHYPRPEEIGHAMQESRIMNQILGGAEGVAEGRDANGVDRLYAYTPLYASAEPDAYVIISIPTRVAFRNTETNFVRDLAALGVGAILALGAAWLASGRFVLNQVTSLLNATRRLSAGDLTARTGKAQGSRELVQLANAFDEMAETLEKRETESRQHQEQIQRQTERAETLTRTAHRLNAHLNLPSVLDAIYEEASRALNVQAGLVNLDSGNSLSCAGRFGLLKECTGPIEPVPCAAQSAPCEGDVLRVCPDISGLTDVPNRELYARLNFHTTLCVDLLHEGRRIGNLTLFSIERLEFSHEDLALLQAIADEAALAISNAQLYAALQKEERARTNLLHRVITAQENERMRIARELHDETGQSLSALLLGLDVGEIIIAEDTDQAQAHLRD
ncbi:MAG TPA: cache domain-containing protein, partial [Anaerolineae bacterium]